MEREVIIKMILKNFQIKAVEELSKNFLELWKTENRKIPIIFKAPTGAGKTIMMAEFLRCLDGNYNFDVDKAYIWISFSEDSYNQSKEKLWSYFNEGTDMHLKDLTNLNEGKLYKNNIFFINWQKLKATNKDGRKLRQNTETTEIGLFDDFIKNTQIDGRELVLLIDEAHIHTSSKLSEELIDLIDPKIIIKITATPKQNEIPTPEDIGRKKSGYIYVLEDDVKREGLIKVSTLIQTEEEIEKIKSKELDESLILLELAYNKREELQRIYVDNKIKVNPLVLIQLPNDDKETKEIQDELKAKLNNYLIRKDIKDYEIAIWLSKEKKNLEEIKNKQSKVKFLFFKQAIATGWDCPKAQILVMYREIKTPTFQIQTLGRIRRMPEAKHYEEAKLNKCYVYTNYNKSQIKDVTVPDMENKPSIYFVKIKKEIKPITLESIYRRRIDHNTLSPEDKFQKFFLECMDKKYGTKKQFIEENKKIVKTKRLITDSSKIDNSIFVSKDEKEIESYDNFIEELRKKTKDINFKLSNSDEEKLYNLSVFVELKDLYSQEDERAHFNPSRSWSPLKKALNVWFMTRIEPIREKSYRIITRNLRNKTGSDLSNTIKSTLIKFNDVICQKHISDERTREEIFLIDIPQEEKSFTEDFEKMQNINKNIYNEFYIKKDYQGKKNETSFIEFLEEQKNVLWWHKQEDKGREEFAVLYYNEKKKRLFYPDFIIRTKNKVYILDTKKGSTLTSQETKDKAEALQKWIKENQKNYKFELIGGIAKYSHPNWEINSKEEYNHNIKEDRENLNNVLGEFKKNE